MSESLRYWLNHELDRRGWSYNELGRRAGLSSAGVSDVLSGKRPASPVANWYSR